MHIVVVSSLLAHCTLHAYRTSWPLKPLQINRMVAKARKLKEVPLLGGQQLAFDELKGRVLHPDDAITVSCLAGMGGVGAYCLILWSSAWAAWVRMV